jgi:fumarate reductase subunit D
MKISNAFWFIFDKLLGVKMLVGPIFTLAGIVAFVLVLIYLKDVAERVVAFLAVAVTLIGIFLTWVHHEEHRLDHYMD